MADPPSFIARPEFFAEAVEHAAWITPAGEVKKTTDHNEIYRWQPDLESWNDAFEQGWIRIGKQFGLAFAHGSPAAIERNKDVIMRHLQFNEIALEFYITRFDKKSSIVSREEFIEMSVSDVLRRIRMFQQRRPGIGVRMYRRQI